MLHALHDLTAVDILITFALLCIAVYLFGSVGHAVLRQNGFGVLINGLLLFVGMALGVFTRAMTIGVH